MAAVIMYSASVYLLWFMIAAIASKVLALLFQ